MFRIYTLKSQKNIIRSNLSQLIELSNWVLTIKMVLAHSFYQILSRIEKQRFD